MIEDPLKQTRRRAERYRFEDGILEVSMGGMAFLLGLYFYILAAYPESQVSEFLTGFFLVLFLGGWYLMRKMAEKLKERITYPRNGYAAPREARSNKGLRAAAAVTAAVLVAAGAAYFQLKVPPMLNFMPVTFALVLGLLFAFLGFKTNLARFFVMAFISLILGGWFALAPINNVLALAAYLLAMALVMLAWGGLTLREYLRCNPVASEIGDGR